MGDGSGSGEPDRPCDTDPAHLLPAQTGYQQGSCRGPGKDFRGTRFCSCQASRENYNFGHDRRERSCGTPLQHHARHLGRIGTDQGRRSCTVLGWFFFPAVCRFFYCHCSAHCQKVLRPCSPARGLAQVCPRLAVEFEPWRQAGYWESPAPKGQSWSGAARRRSPYGMRMRRVGWSSSPVRAKSATAGICGFSMPRMWWSSSWPWAEPTTSQNSIWVRCRRESWWWIATRPTRRLTRSRRG